MTDLTTLAARVEAGTADEHRELLYDAWDALGPMRRLPLEQAGDFATFVDYGAYVDAAMMLAPERWRLRQINLSAPCADDRKWHLNLHGGQVGQDCLVGRGATLALAIAAAALRAHAYISDGGSALREMVRKAALRARAWPLEDDHG